MPTKADTSEQITQVTRLISLAKKNAELWHASDGRCYVTRMEGGVRSSFPIQSRDCEQWLRRSYFGETRKAPNTSALGDAIAQLDAIAQYTGTQHVPFLRVGEAQGVLYLDLADEKGRAAAVTPNGWDIVSNPDVRFVRTPGMMPIPVPERGGTATELRGLLNVGSEDDFVLAVAFLVAPLRPTGPFPILFLQGEQGSAKSTTARLIRRLIDPTEPPDKTKPRSEQDLFIEAENNWLLVYNNLSGVPPWLSDAFCRVATGAGFSTRKLYTGREEEVFGVCRPQILNGIDDLAVRDDLRDRGLLIELPIIEAERRRQDKDFWSDFEKIHPRVLGALLDAVSAALRRGDTL